MKKNGFTLVEMLAVVLMIGVLAVITGPMVLKALENARVDSFKRDVEGIVRTIKTSQDENNFTSETYTITNGVIKRSNGDTLNTKGGSTENGSAEIDMDGYIRIAVSKGKWCATKGSKVDKITVNTNASSCTLPS